MIVKAKMADVGLSPNRTREPDPAHVNRLATTLQNGGYLPPPRAVKTATGYAIKSGQHRFLAHQKVGAEFIDLEVADKPLTPIEILLDQWRENSDRLGFNLPEQAALILAVQKELGCAQEEVADHLGISAGQVSKVLQVSKHLAPDLQAKIVSGELNPMKAYQLSKIRDHDKQRELAAKDLKRDLLEKLIGGLQGKRAKTKKAVKGKTRNGTVYAFQADLDIIIADLAALIEAARKAQKLGLPPDSINSLLSA